jgi:hypothetical protein
MVTDRIELIYYIKDLSYLLCFLFVFCLNHVNLVSLLCFTPLFYSFVLLLCFTPLFYSFVSLLCFTPLLYSFVVLLCFTPVFYSFVLLYSFHSCFTLLLAHLDKTPCELLPSFGIHQ